MTQEDWAYLGTYLFFGGIAFFIWIAITTLLVRYIYGTGKIIKQNRRMIGQFEELLEMLADYIDAETARHKAAESEPK